MTTEDTCPLCTATVKDAFVCEGCGDGYATDLKALVDWLHEELETTMAGTKGVGFASGRVSSNDPGLRVNWRAAEIYRGLQRALCDAVDHCLEVGTTNSSPRNDDPARTISAMALWLTWRVDGLCLDPKGPRLVGDLVKLVDRAEALLAWEPPERHFMGRCSICEGGYLYAEGDAEEAICDRCSKAFTDIDGLRAGLEAQLDDKLGTAAEIAHLSTYLGLRDNRERVARYISMWHHRKRLTAHGPAGKHPKFRFGDVYPLLKEREERKTADDRRSG